MTSAIGPVQKWRVSDASRRHWVLPHWTVACQLALHRLKGSPRRNRYFFTIACIWVLALHLTHLMAKSDDTPIVWGPPVEPPGSVVVTSVQTDLTSAALHGQDHADGLATDGPGVEMLEGEKKEEALVAVLPDGLAVTLQQWSNAWRRQDMPAYLDMYSSDFVPSGGLSRPAWARSRTQRIMEKSNIRHEMRNLVIEMGASTAVVTFTQIYQDDKLKMTDQKTMHWVYRDGLWLIALEKTG